MNQQTTIVLLRTDMGKLVWRPLGMNKFISGLVGLGLYDWTGMLIGLLIGSVLDAKFIPKPAAEKEVNLQLHYMMLGVYVLQRCNGFRVIPISEILRRFNMFLGADFVAPRIRMLEDMSRQRIQVEAACKQIEANALPTTRDWLLQQLAGLSDHPGVQQNYRKAVLKQVADRLGRGIPIPEEETKKAPPPPRKPAYSRTDSLYRKLECQPGDDHATVKKAYYRLAKIHHPDRNQHSPMSVVRFREIKEAYEGLCRIKGWR